jgi:hypothetical protein
LKEEAEKYRKRRDSTVDHDKQLRLAVQEIEQVKHLKKKIQLSNFISNSYVLHYVKQKNMHNINHMNHQVN